jgi:predicted phosphodiesterase
MPNTGQEGWAYFNESERDRLTEMYYEEGISSIDIMKMDIVQESGIAEETLKRRLRERHSQQDQEVLNSDSGTTIKMAGNTNSLTLNAKSLGRITSLEELLEYANVNLEVWEVERYLVNKWEVAAKNIEKDLEYDEGKATGIVIQQPNMVVQDLIQVKAWLVRKEPIPISFVVQPITLNVDFPLPLVNAIERGVHKALIIPDVQIGFVRQENGKLIPMHDRNALDAALQLAQAYDWDKIIFLGDYLDLAEWSDKFVRSPDMYFTTQASLIEGSWWLTQFRKANVDTPIYLIEGNHEKRMTSALLSHLVAASKIRAVNELTLDPSLSVPKLLALHQLGIEWVGNYPNGQVWLNDDFVVIHGDIARGKTLDTARAVVENSDVSTIFGHIHRVELATRTIHRRNGGIRTVVAASMGCLCKLTGDVPGVRDRQQWQNGLGVVEYTDGGWGDIHTVFINDGTLIYGGSRFSGRERSSEIHEAYPDFFQE